MDKKVNILIVDDNEQNLYLLKVLLEGNGYALTLCRNGNEALEAARLNPPDLIISDILMPGLDGFALCRQWLSDEKFKKIPFVFYTATYTDPKDESFSLDLGAARFIRKPQEPEKFIAIIKEVLNEYQAGTLKQSPSDLKEEIFYKQYNESLIRKMEDKLLELEKANQQLEELNQSSKTLTYRIEAGLRAGNLAWWDMELPSGKVTFDNRKAEMLGYSPDEFSTYEDFTKLLHPEDHPKIMQAMQDHLDGKAEVYEVEYRIKTNSGSYKWFRDIGAITEKNAATGQMRVIGIVEDISKHKEAEQKLFDEALRHRNLMDQSRDGIVILDQRGGVYEANQRFADMLGYSREEIAKLHLWDWDYQIPKSKLLQMVRSVDEKGDHFETQHKRKDGGILDIEISTNAAVFAGQKLIFCVCRDITERKRTAQALEEYSNHLEELVEERTRALEQAQQELITKEKLATMGQLAGSVGHELRNPLGVINNAVYILEASLPAENKKAREFAQMIASQVKKSNRIISDLLAFAKEPETSKSVVDIAHLVKQVLQNLPPPQGVDVKTSFARNLPPAYADAQHVEQILTNLISNAYQAMPHAGTLQIQGKKEKDGVHIAIKDSGVGIQPENMPKIFTPLYTTKATGIGLGLPIAKKLAETNGGRIKVESIPNQGSTFTLILPMAGGQNDQ